MNSEQKRYLFIEKRMTQNTGSSFISAYENVPF